MKGTHVLFVLLKLIVLTTPALSAAVQETRHTQTTTTTTTTVIKSEAVNVYLEQNFRTVNSASNSKEKHGSKEKLKRAIDELIQQKSDFFSTILQTQEYFDHFVKIFKYKGERTEQALKEFLYNNTVKIGKVKKFALVMKHITRNNFQHKPLPQYARKNYAYYAVRVFADWSEDADGSHFVKARLRKLFNLEAEETTYLSKILQNDMYAEYLSRVTGYTGDWHQKESFARYLYDMKEYKPRLVGCGIKYIARNQRDANSPLDISPKAQELLIRIREERTKITTEYTQYFNQHFAQVKSDSDGDKDSMLRQITDIQKRHRNWLVTLLQDEQYYNFVKDCIGYQEPQHVEYRAYELAKYWMEHYCTKETSVYTSVILKTIYRHTENRSVSLTRESSRYISTHYSKYVTHTSTTTTTTTQTHQQQQYHQQQNYQQSTFQTHKQEITNYLSQKFANINSDSEGDRETIMRSMTEFKDHHKEWMLSILKEEQYYNFVKDCLKYDKNPDQQNKAQELTNYWVNHFFTRETSIYTSIILKTIYRHTVNQSVTLSRESSRYLRTHYSKYTSTTTTTTHTQHQQQQQYHQQQQHQQQSTFQTYRQDITNYFSQHFARVQSDSAGDRESIMRSIVEFKDQHKNWLISLLQEQQYYNFVKECIGYEEKQNIQNQVEELANYWINHYYTRETSVYTSVILKTIYKHTINQSVTLSIQTSRYLKTHYSKYVTTRTTTTHTQHQQYQQQQQHQQVQQHTQVDYTQITQYLSQHFANAHSNSDEKQSWFNQITQFKDHHHDWMVKLLEKKEYYEYVKACTGYEEKQHQQNHALELKNHWVNHFYKQEGAVYTALMLRNIYKHMVDSSFQLTKESSRYISTHYSRFTTTTHTETHQQSSHQVSHQSSNVQSFKEEAVCLQSFATLQSQSDADIKTRAHETIMQLQNSKREWLLNVLRNNEYYNYVSKCLGVHERVSAEQLYQIWSENFFKQETSQFTAIILKNIYRYMTGQATELKTTNYISSFQTHESYQHIVETVTQTVTTSTTTHVEQQVVAG